MSVLRIKQAPLALRSAKKRQVRSQFGAICYRMRKGKPEILLITSRGRGRWIIPKGWPMADLTPAEAAAQEAYEEAGVEGRVHPLCMGIYSYAKGRDGTGMPCVVALYAVQVTRLLRNFPERHERKRRWYSLKRAAQLVEEPELKEFISQFRPDGLPPAHPPRHRGS